MLIIPKLESDEVRIQGFNRDASPVYKDFYNAPYFDVLSFDLSAFPSKKWIETFKNRARQSIDTTIAEKCVFEGATLTVSTDKTHAHSLQEFIDSLKIAFDSINEIIQQEQDREKEQDKNLNDILDNLKF